MGRLVRLAVAISSVAAASLVLGACTGLFRGTPPQDLGVSNGRLAPCKPTPNCVSSFADPRQDPGHYVAPLAFRGDSARAWAELVAVVRATDRVAVVRESSEYLRAEYTSRLMGFVDDVEFVLDPAAKQIHVRSASRLGHSDLGVNRARIEALRARLDAAGA